jgi:hypothetical protein
MNNRFVIALAIASLLGAAAANAAGDGAEVEKNMVIALETDEFELQETDISHLAVGESETIVTEGGQTIDLLRTADGVEIYVDGELLETGLHGDPALHGGYEVIHKRVEVVCEDEGSCEKLVWVSDDADIDLDMLSEVDHEVIMLHDAHVDAEHIVELAPGEHAEKIIIIREKAETD